MCLNKNSNYSQTAKQTEWDRETAINTGTQNINQAFGGFDSNFYDDYKKSYENYAEPQLAQQYLTNRNLLVTGLSNKGMLNSSVAQQGAQTLQSDLTSGQQTIADTAISKSQELKSKVEGQKSTLLSQLYQSADPYQAKASALSTASGFTVPSVFTGIGNAFSNLADYGTNAYLNNYYNNVLSQEQQNNPYYGYSFGGNNSSSSIGASGYNPKN